MDNIGESSGDPPLKVFNCKPEALTWRDSDEAQYLWNDATQSILEARHVKRKTACDLDFGTLDCPNCMKRLSPPVYQCQNDHTTCAACCKKLMKRCLSCSLPIGSNRNTAVEKILESVQVGCKHADQGCQEVLKYTMKKNHEEHFCKFRPYHCPVPSCMLNCPKEYVAFALGEGPPSREI